MTQHDDITRLRHMLDHAAEAVDMTAGRKRVDLDTDRQLQLALTRLVEIVGEAATHVSLKGRERWPNIPWRSIIALRNRLIHGYDAVDLSILWAIVREDLPPLILELRRVLDEEHSQD